MITYDSRNVGFIPQVVHDFSINLVNHISRIFAHGSLQTHMSVREFIQGLSPLHPSCRNSYMGHCNWLHPRSLGWCKVPFLNVGVVFFFKKVTHVRWTFHWVCRPYLDLGLPIQLTSQASRGWVLPHGAVEQPEQPQAWPWAAVNGEWTWLGQQGGLIRNFQCSNWPVLFTKGLCFRSFLGVVDPHCNYIYIYDRS